MKQVERIEQFLEQTSDSDGLIAEWSYKVYEMPGGEIWVEFQQFSPKGEDFIITVDGNTPEEIITAVRDYYEDYDAEEHAAMWYGQNRGEPSSLRALLDDADDIDGMIEQLAMRLSACEIAA